MLAAGCKKEVDDIKWIDGMLLWKWYSNSQHTEAIPDWSLLYASERWCLDAPWFQEFHDMKQQEVAAGENDEYWHRRAQLDAIATREIVKNIWAALDPKRRRAAIVEMECLVPVAASWVRGIRVDSKAAAALEPVITDEMQILEKKLDVVTVPKQLKRGGISAADKRKMYPNGWIPSDVLSSPKKLATLLYTTWGMKVESVSEKTGQPSTDKAALTYLSDKNENIFDIMRWRELNTQRTKFINGIIRAVEYCGSDVIHPSPRLFSTYTGRMTYASKIKKKYPIGVAIHQWPRNKVFRRLILAHEDASLGEIDAAGQEVRFMADFSQDENMVRVLNMAPPNDDIHSFTGSGIAGMSFEDFLKAKAAKNEAVVGEFGYRYCGKYINLSNQYRVGARKSRIVARVQYKIDKDFPTIKSWQNAYFRLYPGVKVYWGDAIYRAKEKGYAETLAGRRFGIHKWTLTTETWSSESSAINTPIQGSGADMKELAIAVIRREVPEIEFSFDLHDGLYYWIPKHLDAKVVMTRVKYILDRLPYKKAWNWTPSVPMIWDATFGDSWGNMESV